MAQNSRPPPRLCSQCQVARAVLKRPKNHEQLCRECFYAVFEEEVHHTIVSQGLFTRGERVAIAASGGKDSTVLAHTLTTLNKRHDYGLDLFLLSIDEGITGYRDDSLETVKRNEATYGIPLLVVSYQQLYGWTMDEIVGQIGTRNNCTFCGVFRRQALDRGAVIAKANKIATGHNADDVAETVLLNLLRGDTARLSRCASAITGGDELGGLTRVKPFKYSYEKEIVMYAYFKRLDYFSTECIYAPFAARGYARDFVKDLEAARPTAILDLIRSAENFRFPSQQRLPAASDGGSMCSAISSGANAPRASRPTPRQCERCGYISSQRVCKSCVLLEGLNKGRPGGLAPTLPRTHADFSHHHSIPPAPAPSAAHASPAAQTTGPASAPGGNPLEAGAAAAAAVAPAVTAAAAATTEGGHPSSLGHPARPESSSGTQQQQQQQEGAQHADHELLQGSGDGAHAAGNHAAAHSPRHSQQGCEQETPLGNTCQNDDTAQGPAAAAPLLPIGQPQALPPAAEGRGGLSSRTRPVVIEYE